MTTEKIYVKGLFSDGTKRDLNSSASGTMYESSDPTVATVSTEGMVRRVGGGRAFITVRNGDKQVKVEIVIPVINQIVIEPTPATISMSEGRRTLQLKVSGIHSIDGHGEILTQASTGTTYQSSDEKVVRVGRNGNLHAVARGQAEITVRHADVSAQLPVEVK